MKKALQISIAGTLFTIEDDAYAALDGYLTSVKQHFESNAEKNEIVADIEARIAEQLLDAGEKVITLPTVERILAQMGTVDDFDNTGERTDGSGATAKKLYRSTDDRIIAGVCAGLASYFGFEPLWVRLAFVLLTFLNGIGIVVYAVLWLLIPEAKTTSQKLEMTGTPVTLETLSETVSERVAELKTSGAGNRLGRLIALPFRIIGTIVRVVLGLMLTVGSAIAIVALMLAGGFLLSGSTIIADDMPLSVLLPGIEHWVFLIAGMIALVVPLMFVLLSGASLLAKRNVMHAQASLAFLGIWFVALMLSGFGVARVIANYQNHVENSPAYQETTLQIPLDGAFDALVVERGASLSVVQGTSTEATLVVSGREKYIDSYEASIADGTLTIARKPLSQRGACLFCGIQHPSLTLTIPALEQATVRNGGAIRSRDFPAADTFTLSLADGAVANITLDVSELNAALKDGAYLSIDGTASAATFTLTDGAVLRGRDFAVEEAIISGSRGAFAEIQASVSLEAKALSGGIIRYTGDAEVEAETSGGGRITEF